MPKKPKPIYENIAVTLKSADENLKALLKEYNKSLSAKSVSAEAIDLTHQICGQLRSVLDRIAYRCWKLQISPSLSETDAKRAKVYFPAAGDEASFKSTLGGWRFKQADNPDLHAYLLAQQPFTSNKNRWLTILFDLAVQGKHIDLVPQTRVEERRITVERKTEGFTSSVSWNPDAVRFGSSGPGFQTQVLIGGAPINPLTQRIVPTEGVTERIEVWHSFLIADHNVNAASFCTNACRDTRRIVQEMTDQFGLS